MKHSNCKFCMLPERDATKEPCEREILLDKGSVYVVVPHGYTHQESLLIIPKYHWESFADAVLNDSSVARDAALAEKQAVKEYFGAEAAYWPSENCGEVGGNSGRSVGHAHRWLINCRDGENATGWGVATLRRLVNELPMTELSAALTRLREGA